MGAKQSTSAMNEIDLSSYLSQDDANNLYQVKPPEDDEFILKTYADRTYKIPLDYATKDELKAYLLEDKAKTIYQELPPKGDNFVLKSYTDQLYKLSSNYATVDELNKYITQTSANSLFQPKGSYATLQANGNLIVPGTITNQNTDFYLGSNTIGRGIFNNSMPSGRALVQDSNSTLAINFAGDFGGGVRIDGRNGLTLSNGGINANTPGTQSNIANLNISNGFNAPKSNSAFYGITVDSKLCFGPGKCISKDTPGISWSS